MENKQISHRSHSSSHTNRRGIIGFVISLVCMGLMTGALIWNQFSQDISDVMKICLIVMVVFIILLSLLGVILSAGAIKSHPKALAIIGTVISGLVLIKAVILLLTVSFNSHSLTLIY